MVAVVEAPARRRVGNGDHSELAAAILQRDGRRVYWRDCRLLNDPDVAAWEKQALNGLNPDYATLFWWELDAIRARRN